MLCYFIDGTRCSRDIVNKTIKTT